MKQWLHWLIVVGLSVASFSVKSKDDTPAIQAALAQAFPQASISDIQPSPITGLYQASLGGTILYISSDGHYVIQGDLYDIQKQKPVNLTESARQDVRRHLLADIPAQEMIRYEAANEQHVITVFTDIDCGYCRRFHQQISSLNDKGITVRYLAFPRSGPGTASFDKMVSVWCSRNPKAAMTHAKAGDAVNSKQCNHPIQKQFELGLAMGVQGTPSLLLEDGTLIPGFATTEQLLKLIQ